MMKFISLGSGSSGNCYYVFTEKGGLMIDVGIGVRALKKSFHDFGLSIASINNILLTHDHADHVKSVGSISHDFSIPVFSTRKVHAGVAGNYCVRQKMDFKNVRYIEKNVTFSLGDLVITPFEVPHDSLDNVGYMISHEGVNFCIAVNVA